MSQQIGSLFDAPLVDIPKPLAMRRVAAPPTPSDLEKHEFEERVRVAIADLGKDDISTDEVLTFMGMEIWSIKGWHRSRVLSVVAAPFSDWQTYAVGSIAKKIGDPPTVWRHRRLAPLLPCPGYADIPCGSPTRGGKLCEKHEALERAEFAKNDPPAAPVVAARATEPDDDIEPFAPLQEGY